MTRLKLLIFILATAFITTVSAEAKTHKKLSYPVVGTAQTKAYSNSSEIELPSETDAFYGQNANFQGASPSYTNNGDGTITDNVTGLTWTKSYKVMGYNDAVRDVKKMGNGWRIPSIKEAYSLIIFSGTDPSNRDMNLLPEGSIPFIDTDYFDFKYGSNGTRVIDVQILSTSIYKGLTMGRDKTIFGVNVADGRIKGYPMSMRGEDKLYTVYYVKGESYGENDFVDNGDGTISDNATGLMWSKTDSGQSMNWQSALEYAQRLNKAEYLGYNDWRVPDVKELHTILDYSRSPQSTSSAAIDPIFEISSIKDERGQQNYPYFWSSTTHENAIRGGVNAAYVSFGEALGYMRGNLLDVHGAGAQRSDSKAGRVPDYKSTNSPQGDVRRINNYVRVVRYMK